MPAGEQMLDLRGEARGIERGYEKRAALHPGSAVTSLRRMPGEVAALAFHVLHIVTRQRQPRDAHACAAASATFSGS